MICLWLHLNFQVARRGSKGPILAWKGRRRKRKRRRKKGRGNEVYKKVNQMQELSEGAKYGISASVYVVLAALWMAFSVLYGKIADRCLSDNDPEYTYGAYL
ncbi:hypothetical protein TraAM80_04255 [Trypanosoma rangeli]|uniref:Uncharacterized protein n=1 Tax=Trypanosoma rangeli TaxID=5698 RepID=A0A3R7RKB0_TRYRA|nr:uncharacterized protein TraAM80_04255 [Trypanosoma rangeli]RNF05876.1 hypothetical protein TraAM80_04255 [Trypanosoma rangeli]|eukprot:RNF05876.1 hypothetical protein TraAM80_04255 [Trypanosoma rangeli]